MICISYPINIVLGVPHVIVKSTNDLPVADVIVGRDVQGEADAQRGQKEHNQ